MSNPPLVPIFVRQDLFGNTRGYELVDIIFRERAGYKPMHFSSMTSCFTNETILDKMHDYSQKNIFRGSEYSAMANSLIKPKLGGNAVTIANGFESRRAMFFLTIAQKTVAASASSSFLKHVFVGFTDNFDIIRESNLNKKARMPDNMRMTFNHVFTFRVTPTKSTFGGTSNESILLSSHQIYAKNYAIKDTFRNQNKIYGVRPCDVFSRMQSSGIMEGFSRDTMMSVDDRFELSSHNQKSLRFSDRVSNNNAGTYLEKTVRAIIMGTNEAKEDPYATEHDAVATSYNVAADGDLSIGGDVATPAMEFLDSLCRNYDYASQGYVNYKDFANYFGSRVDDILNVKGKVSVLTDKSVRDVKALLDSMQDWRKKTKQTEIALLLGHSVPTYMLRHGIMEYGFVSTNDMRVSSAGSTGFITRPVVEENRALGSVRPIMACTSFNKDQQVWKFFFDIETELLRTVSHQCQQKLTVVVKCSLVGETVIRVNWENDPVEEFIIPTFCDQLFGPMATDSIQDLEVISEDVHGFSMKMSEDSFGEIGGNLNTSSFASGLSSNSNKVNEFNLFGTHEDSNSHKSFGKNNDEFKLF